MEEIVKTVDLIYGDMITAMSQIDVIIAAVTGGTDVNNGDVAGSLVVLREYIEKRVDILEPITDSRYGNKGGIPTWK